MLAAAGAEPGQSKQGKGARGGFGNRRGRERDGGGTHVLANVDAFEVHKIVNGHGDIILSTLGEGHHRAGCVAILGGYTLDLYGDTVDGIGGTIVDKPAFL